MFYIDCKRVNKNILYEKVGGKGILRGYGTLLVHVPIGRSNGSCKKCVSSRVIIMWVCHMGGAQVSCGCAMWEEHRCHVGVPHGRSTGVKWVCHVGGA